jgi:hypothetical protein
VKVKRLFSTTPVAEIFSKPSWIETEANGGHWGDRTWSRYDRTRSISGRAVHGASAISSTGASGQASIGTTDRKVDRTWCVSGREWMLTGNDRTLALWRLVCQAYTSGRGFTRVGC